MNTAEEGMGKMDTTKVQEIDLCRKCGKCCQLKICIGEKVFLSENYCIFFDTKTRLCRNFEHRLENKWCINIARALETGSLPPDCPYAVASANYKTRVEDWK